jgi:hypothetical protein
MSLLTKIMAAEASPFATDGDIVIKSFSLTWVGDRRDYRWTASTMMAIMNRAIADGPLPNNK